MEPTRHQIVSFGDLREFVRGFSADDDATPIYCQVVSADGKAWGMWADIGLSDKFNPPLFVLTFSHPELTTMPEWPAREND